MPRHRRPGKWAAAHRTTCPRRKGNWTDIDATRVHVGSLVKQESRRFRPPGFCVDIGAPKSCIGRKELNRFYALSHRRAPALRKSRNRFRFADTSFESLGQVTIPLATPPGKPTIEVVMDVVQADIPALLGMDVLDRESLIADTVANRLTKRSACKADDGSYFYYDEWHVPLFRSASSHVYAEMDTSVNAYFTRSQLAKIHRHFMHPSAGKLFNLLRKARPEEATPETLKELQDLAKRCDPCQRIQTAPTRFRVSFGAENVRFNERVLLDVMYIDGRPVLHIVDEGTRFSAARFLSDVSTKTIWATIIDCWASIYTGLPNRMLVDQGSAFGSLFIHMACASNVEVNRTGIEAHNSLGLGERYHQPLRQTYRKIKVQHQKIEPATALSAAVKAINDTLGPEGLVPSALVFGEYPRAFTRSEKLPKRPTVEERGEVANTARQEMERLMAELRVKRALRHNPPSAADRSYKPGDDVLVWREKQVESRIGEWLGPFKVSHAEENKKLIYVQDSKIGAARPFNVAQVKPYFTADTLAHSFLMDLESGPNQFSSKDDSDVFLTEVLDFGDPRARSPEMVKAKRDEIKGLPSRGAFKVILKEDIPPDGNVLPGRFVLAIKSNEDGKIKYKARYVIGGHRDKFKDLMVHSSSTLQPQSVRLLLALAAIFGFDIWTSDVTQAYLQSAEPLARDIFIAKPVAEFELEPSQCLQLLKPLYGLCESGDLWHETLDRHHREDLGMTPFRFDPALYALVVNGILHGLSGGYVDDLIRTGNGHFREVSAKTKGRFDMKEDEPLPCTFAGFSLSRNNANEVVQDQHEYLKRLEILPLDASFTHFRSVRMKLAWLANTRPDCMFEISQLAQVTEERFESSQRLMIRRLNRAVKFAITNRVSLRIPKLSMDSLRIIGYSDASFANNADLSSQLGHICFLGDESGAVIPISFKSYKARRVTRSAMAGEVIAFSDLFDIAATLSQELGAVLGKKVPVQLLTDSKCLFDVISKGSRTSEKRMMLDIAAAREGFTQKVISDIGFVRSSQNIADGLTKVMQQQALQTVLREGKLLVQPEQWIIRK